MEKDNGVESIVDTFEEHVWQNNIEAVEKMMKAGYDVNQRNKHWNTPLHIAAGNYRIDKFVNVANTICMQKHSC